MSSIDWAGLLAEEDVEGLWNSLYQMISRHPAVRPLHFATDGAAVASPTEINADLTQELFLELFQKRRFDHYVEHRYSSANIENELARIEIPNLVGARLRKRYPESFRMARRVSALLKTSARFRRFGPDAGEQPARRRGRPKKSSAPPIEEDDADLFDEFEEAAGQRASKGRHQRMVSRVYGLREWPDSKPVRDPGHFADNVRRVPMRKRDTRIVGRSGTSQLILSNPELEALIVEVLEAIDSPADVRTLRQLVLSKIPLQDYNVASLDEEIEGEAGTPRRVATDTRETPEGALLRDERHQRAAEMAGEFLAALRRAVNNNERRYTRLLSTLWHCYYDPRGLSQLEIARLLGISDSLVSDNRRLIEHELKRLNLSLEEGAVFAESLQHLIAPPPPAQRSSQSAAAPTA